MSNSQERLGVTFNHLNKSNRQLTVAVNAMVPPLTTHVLDTAVGLPAASVPMILSRQNSTGAFDEVERGTTNSDGRGSFLASSQWQTGVYKLHFDTDAYFKSKQGTGFYPYVEVVFRIENATQHYHVPLLLSPYGYSTYRGS